MNGADGEQRGVIPRAVARILDAAGRLRDGGWAFELRASFIEIYNEGLRDLLGQDDAGRPAGTPLDGNCIKHAAGGHTEVRRCPLAA